MALAISTQDLTNYPGTAKTVYVDLLQVVPVGYQGDEQYMLRTYTNAYSDNEARTSIASEYILEPIVGWSKSSGFTGTAGKYVLTSSAYKLGVKIDATVSGTDQQGFYEIDLYQDGTALLGEDVASDMQEKIRSITCEVADTGFQLAYTNAIVEYRNGKFYISSGTISDTFTGSARSSVRVYPASTYDCSSILGFDKQVTSEDLAGTVISETLLATDYTVGASTLTVSAGSGAVTGDSFYITDGVNSEYFTPISVASNVLTVPVSGTNGFNAIKNNYNTVSGTYLQIVKKNDPEYKPLSYITDIDDIVRTSIKNIIGQIDYSS